MTCVSCRFYRGTVERGDCRRNPPTVLPLPADPAVAERAHVLPQTITEWPRVLPDDWCGCHETGGPSAEDHALSVVRAIATELQDAAGALFQAARYLKDDGKGFRATQAHTAAQKARMAAESLLRG